MLGTDYPFDMAEPDPVGFLGGVKGVSTDDKAKVAGGNAARLLGIRPVRKKAVTKAPKAASKRKRKR
jgi:aminocarboxymuconate-semialdehyde decarboxylase